MCEYDELGGLCRITFDYIVSSTPVTSPCLESRSGDETMMEEVSLSAPLLFLILLSNMGVVGDNLPDNIEADVVEDPCVYVVVPQTRWRMSLATTRQKL